MQNCAIVGINWGDEGKGRMVDLLTEDFDVVVRYQGGGNAGHTVINEKGEFALHLLPSGIFRDGVVNILGNGVALDPENLWTEIQEVAAKGVAITPDNLKISDRASLLLPWHRDLDGLEEARLADKQFVRNWLLANWDFTGEPPRLPQEVIDQTSKIYIEAYEQISGKTFGDFE